LTADRSSVYGRQFGVKTNHFMNGP
jgi:hypothetical protein